MERIETGLSKEHEKLVEKIGEEVLVELSQMLKKRLDTGETSLDKKIIMFAQEAALAYFVGVHAAENHRFASLIENAIEFRKSPDYDRISNDAGDDSEAS